MQLIDEIEDWLDAIFKSELDRSKHVGFADFCGADFNHVDAIRVSRKDEIKIAEFHLRLCWIYDEVWLIINEDASDAHRCDWSIEWSVGNVQRSGCS